ncbi:element excision factor XisH family protein [Limnoraphis robusta Tam1]|uniref:Element excision factor XisH family protein n=1 Tax=Limnoraphis robusta CCNP1315 TaxID=3110306 RepID=A0ABU5U260_9CYAN|nr:element excision factor XisH family protein [Limnoraphis robusta]MEA5521179.1 element excision factor XisH family protein [Limnoraphis robusta CCNP1315]MEA5537940.1 element excision factor XisH family protein [Limnoraphis robusta Tam1]MEA5546671.1 element excision factor XisH family protein [Limnoraphis robusta CCNP1324]
MPAKDLYHNTVRTALIKDGWTITHDPFKMIVGGRSIYVDLGAKKLFAAEKEGCKIAVEIKSFLEPSPVSELEKALGQYELYSLIMEDEDPERVLYLAVINIIFEGFLSEEIGQRVIRKKKLRLIIFDADTEEIIEWIA